MENNIVILSDRILRKREKVFKKLSEIIQTRSPSQCRSHHQKMMR